MQVSRCACPHLPSNGTCCNALLSKVDPSCLVSLLTPALSPSRTHDEGDDSGRQERRRGMEWKSGNGTGESVNNKLKQEIWTHVAIISRWDHCAIPRSDVDICRGDHSAFDSWEGSDCAIPAFRHAKRAATWRSDWIVKDFFYTVHVMK